MIFRVIGRLTVRFFKGLGLAVGKHVVTSLIGLILIVGLGVAAYQTNTFGLLNPGDGFNIEVPASDITTGQSGPSPSPASTQFLSGLYHHDGHMVWTSLSDRYRASLGSKNINEATVQNLITTELAGFKKAGLDLKYVKIQMQGATDLANNSTLEIYTNFFRIGDQLGNADVNLVLDKDHKVDLVQTGSSNPEPLVSAVFVKGKATSAQDAQANAQASGTPKAQEGQYSSQATKAADDFMSSITNFDAVKLWNALSEDYKKQLQTNSVNAASIQKSFDDFKASLQKSKETASYQGYALRETINFSGNRTLCKYESVLTVNGQVHTFAYDILTDASGKITNIGVDDPIVTDAFKLKTTSTSGQ